MKKGGDSAVTALFFFPHSHSPDRINTTLLPTLPPEPIPFSRSLRFHSPFGKTLFLEHYLTIPFAD